METFHRSPRCHRAYSAPLAAFVSPTASTRQSVNDPIWAHVPRLCTGPRLQALRPVGTQFPRSAPHPGHPPLPRRSSPRSPPVTSSRHSSHRSVVSPGASEFPKWKSPARDLRRIGSVRVRAHRRVLHTAQRQVAAPWLRAVEAVGWEREQSSQGRGREAERQSRGIVLWSPGSESLGGRT